MENQKYSKEQISLFIVINIILLALITYASTSLTVSFFGSMGAGEVKTSNLIMGLVNDCCKIFLPLVTGIAIFKKKYFHAAILVFIICGCMYISYLASQGLDLNVSNQQLLEGTGKQELIDAKAEKVKEISRLEAEKKELIVPIIEQIESLPGNRITQRGNLQKDINKIVQDYRAKIKAVQDKIDEYGSKIQNYKVDTTLTTQGYHALSKFTGLEVGTITKYKNIFMEILAIILSVNLGLLIGESNFNLFTLIKTGYSAFKNRPKKEKAVACEDKTEEPAEDVIDINSSKNKAQINNSSVSDNTELEEHSQHNNYTLGQSKRLNDYDGTELQSKNKIGFVIDKGIEDNNTVEPCEYTREDIIEYLNCMYGNIKSGNRSPGQNFITDNTYLSISQVRAIRYHLERLKLLRIDNKTNRTFILFSDLNQAIQLI